MITLDWPFYGKVIFYIYSYRQNLKKYIENLQTTSAPERLIGLSPNLVGGIEATWRLRTAKIVSFRCPGWPPDASWKRWEASEWHGNSVLLKSFRSNIQDGRHGGHLENLQTICSRTISRINSNLVGGIEETWKFRIAKIIPVRYPRWPPWPPSWDSSKHLLPNSRLDWAETWCEASEIHRDSESLKLFCSDIQDGPPAAILKIFKPHLLPNGVELSQNLIGGIGATWRVRIAKIICYYIRTDHHGGILENL